MLLFLLIAAMLALMYMTGRYILLSKEIHEMAEDIRRIRREHSNQQLRVQSPNRQVGVLANAVNELFHDVHHTKAEQVRIIDQLHQSMASISHDLRTPLTSIAGYLRLLEDPATTGEQKNTYLQIARSKADSLGDLINSLFTLARLDGGGYPFQMEQLDVGELLSEELAAFYPVFAEHGQEPSLNLHEGPLPVIGDRAALSRVFSNLLQNMVKHGASSISIASSMEGNRIHLSFSNRADNLSQEDVGRLFQRFYTSDPMRSRDSAGLGLSIVKEFVEHMGGTIHACLDSENHLTFDLVWQRRGG